MAGGEGSGGEYRKLNPTVVSIGLFWFYFGSFLYNGVYCYTIIQCKYNSLITIQCIYVHICAYIARRSAWRTCKIHFQIGGE